MKFTGYILIVIAMLFIGLQWVGEWAAVDMCLDSGGVYDYTTSSCRTDIETLPYSRYTERFGWEILAALVVAISGFLLAAKSRRS